MMFANHRKEHIGLVGNRQSDALAQGGLDSDTAQPVAKMITSG